MKSAADTETTGDTDETDKQNIDQVNRGQTVEGGI
jgi:hypothetical protein